ncbi:CAP domain-containing protein [Pedobacter panaciterrae]|uniref:CAP domain-containing protein n=1 Tax=Pedobacter panaciterrae TaxID=363849 RepID=A0ABU8NIZ5_9SPHI|nr:CAP domain-containing protein [Pedobacter panaciterrae]NQX53837.1 CAP domain-containing protein [Pedobacter panaciterrae]
MKLFSISILFLFSIFTSTQVKNTSDDYTWSKEELKMANTAGNSSYLTGEEKDLVIYMNLARMDGEKFFNTYFQDFVEAHNKKAMKYSNYDELKITTSNKYYRSLAQQIRAVKDLPMLWPDEALSIVAKQHARDMNRNNFSGHNSSDGRSVKDRISEIYPKRSNGENLAFGFSSGLDNICMLLLDKGVPDLGHRKMILNDSYGLNYIGVSIQPHKKYGYCAVIDFVALPR